MGKETETAIIENIAVDDNVELGDKYFYPFAGKDFILTKKAYAEAMKLQKEQRFIVINIVEKQDNIFKFKYIPDVTEFKGEIPDIFNKHGVFILKVRGLIFECFIDIFGSNDKCIIFGVRYDKKVKTTVVASNGIDFCVDISN